MPTSAQRFRVRFCFVVETSFLPPNPVRMPFRGLGLESFRFRVELPRLRVVFCTRTWQATLQHNGSATATATQGVRYMYGPYIGMSDQVGNLALPCNLRPILLSACF